jgi:hypothetical protein
MRGGVTIGKEHEPFLSSLTSIRAHVVFDFRQLLGWCILGVGMKRGGFKTGNRY